jgi:hypothetical protein
MYQFSEKGKQFIVTGGNQYIIHYDVRLLCKHFTMSCKPTAKENE